MPSPSTLCLALAAATSTATVAPPAAPDLPPPPTVELVTLGPGEALYALWGHSAIRVIHRAPRRDVAYNFGSIDFSGDTWAKMLSGHVEAFVAVAPYHRMAKVYREEDRSIVRRPLALEPEQARWLAAALADRVEGPDARYRYHHFEDNCATQVADLIDAASGGRVKAAAERPADTTLRKLALEPLRARTLLYVIVDVLLTAPVDREITAWQARFLPSALDGLVHTTTTALGRPLAAPPIVDYAGSDRADRAAWTWPWTKVYLLFVVPLLAAFLRFRKIAAGLWCAVAGGLGLLITVGWLGTTYDFLHGNWNVLVLPPTHLLVLLPLLLHRWLRRPSVRAGVQAYAALHLVVLAGLVVARVTGAVEQAIDPALGLALGPTLALALRPPRATAS